MLKKPPAERLKLLRNAEGPQGQFLWAILRNGFHYAAVHLATIAETARDVDFALRWGFGMKQGPFELWQEAGWLQVAQWVQEDIAAGKALSSAPLPDWVFKGPVADAGGVHTPEGSWNPKPGNSSRAVAAGIPPAPGIRAGQQCTAVSGFAGKTCTRTMRCGGTLIDDGHRQHQDQNACNQHGGGRRPAISHRPGRGKYGAVIWSGDDPSSVGRPALGADGFCRCGLERNRRRRQFRSRPCCGCRMRTCPWSGHSRHGGWRMRVAVHSSCRVV
jgi:3-hydroxyacyl-CoA dehydrogenase